MRHRIHIVSTWIVFCLFFLSCQEEEIGFSSFAVLGNQTQIELLNFTATKDGGFILVYHNAQTGNQKICVSKYSNQLILQWNECIGGNFDNRFDAVLLDRDENVFITGTSYGYEEDNLSLDSSRHWIPINHLLNSNGQTMWKNSITTFVSILDTFQRVTDIVQDSKGKYIVGGNFVYRRLFDPTVYYKSIASINQWSPAGNLEGRSIFIHSPDSIIIFPTEEVASIFEYEGNFYVFKFNNRGSSDVMTVLKTPNTLIPEGVDNFSTVGTENWQEVIGRIEDRVAKLKYQNGPDLWHYAIFPNSFYRIGFNAHSARVQTQEISTEMNNIVHAGETHDNHFLFVQADGRVIETDAELNTIFEFRSDHKVQKACKLQGTGYVAGSHVGKSIYLIRYDREGRIVQND